LEHIYLSKFPISVTFHILYKVENRETSLGLNSTTLHGATYAHNPEAASSRHAGLHHSTQPVTS